MLSADRLSASFLLPISNCGNAFSNLRRELFLNPACTHFGNILNDYRSGCSQGDKEPNQARKGKASQRDELEQMSVIRIVVPNGTEGDKKERGRDRRYCDQPNIDRAM